MNTNDSPGKINPSSKARAQNNSFADMEPKKYPKKPSPPKKKLPDAEIAGFYGH